MQHLGQRVLGLDVEIQDGRGRKIVGGVVCVPFDGEDRYYLTTLPRGVFATHDVAELYRSGSARDLAKHQL